MRDPLPAPGATDRRARSRPSFLDRYAISSSATRPATKALPLLVNIGDLPDRPPGSSHDAQRTGFDAQVAKYLTFVYRREAYLQERHSAVAKPAAM